MWSYQVNLDKRVRDDHPLRRINRVLDLGFVRRQVAHTYGRCGNKSVPPAVILRMMPPAKAAMPATASCRTDRVYSSSATVLFLFILWMLGGVYFEGE